MSETKRCPIFSALCGEVDEITDAKLHDRYDDMLDSCQDPVRIGSLEYSPSVTLKAVDPTAYDCGFSDWLSGEEDIVEIDGAYFSREEVEDWLNEKQEEGENELEELDEIESESESTGDPLPAGHEGQRRQIKDDLAALAKFRKTHSI